MPKKYIEGDVNLRKLYLTELPDFLSGVEIRGYFDCNKNKLTSLKNCPSSIIGEFVCSFNKQLKTLEGGPTYVDTNYECNGCGLESLKGAPTRAEVLFDCGNNQLKTLDFAPAFVGGAFVCSGNGLKSLLKGPLVVDGSYDCSLNKLSNLIGAPDRVGGNFDCTDNNLTSLEGIPKLIIGDFVCLVDEKLTITERDVRALSEIEGSVRLYKRPTLDFDW